jgi:hypothetical protein
MTTLVNCPRCYPASACGAEAPDGGQRGLTRRPAICMGAAPQGGRPNSCTEAPAGGRGVPTTALPKSPLSVTPPGRESDNGSKRAAPERGRIMHASRMGSRCSLTGICGERAH